MAQNACRDCGQPIQWMDTEDGRRPFDADGRSHFTSCTARQQRRNGKERSRAQRQELRESFGHRALLRARCANKMTAM